MKTKRVWKLLVACILMLATWSLGQVTASESGGGGGEKNPSVNISIIDTQSSPDLIKGNYDPGDRDYELTSLEFYVLDDDLNQVPISVIIISKEEGHYTGEFDSEQIEGFDVIGVDATFQNASGATLTANFQGQLYDGNGGQCHEGMCVPVY